MSFLLMAEGGFDPLAVQPGLLFWSIVVFVALFFVLRKVAWGPLTKTIEERESRIKADIESAEKSRVEAEARLAEYEKKLEEAAKEAKQVLEEAREAAGRAREEIVSEARQAAATLKAQAEKDIATAREKAIADIKGQIVEVAMAVSESVLKKAVDQSDHERLTDEVLSRSKGIVG